MAQRVAPGWAEAVGGWSLSPDPSRQSNQPRTRWQKALIFKFIDSVVRNVYRDIRDAFLLPNIWASSCRGWNEMEAALLTVCHLSWACYMASLVRGLPYSMVASGWWLCHLAHTLRVGVQGLIFWPTREKLHFMGVLGVQLSVLLRPPGIQVRNTAVSTVVPQASSIS